MAVCVNTRVLFCVSLLIISATEDHALRRRSSDFGAQLADPDENWEVGYTVKPKESASNSLKAKQQEVFITERKDEESVIGPNIRRIGLLLLCVVGGLLILVTWYQLCMKKKFVCCSLKRIGQKSVNTYVPGVVVHEDGHTSYYEITQKEQDALQDMTGLFD